MIPTTPDGSPIPILFAHRGARADAPENTMEAFDLAVRLGATGIETDAWTTADGVAVLDHDGAIRRGVSLRRTPIASIDTDQLPDHIPTWDDLFDAHGRAVELSVDLKAPGVGAILIDALRSNAPDRRSHVWLCDPDIAVLEALRSDDDAIRLVHSIRLRDIDGSVEQWAQRLAAARIDAINMREPDWNGGLVALFHRFGVKAFMWDVQTEHELAAAFMIGIDAVYSDHVSRLVAAAAAAFPNPG